MGEINSAEMEKFANEIDNKLENSPESVIKESFSGDFQEMNISDIGFGAKDYKSSNPNILKNDAVVNEIKKISAAAETAIAHTIGPYADNTLVQTYYTREVPVYNTRDGYTILQNMKFTQPIPNAIFKMNCKSGYVSEFYFYLEKDVYTPSADSRFSNSCSSAKLVFKTKN